MAVQFYNSLTRNKENFIPVREGEVRMYCCGPTVYNFVHIGNLRAYVFNDLLRRYLKFKGFAVQHVMNITDVDDKTIRDSRACGKSLADFTEEYTRAFLEDLKSLNIEIPEHLPRATQEIDAMVALVQELLERGFAYRADNGDVYFRIASYPEYGKLAHIDLREVRVNASGRLSRSDEYAKEEANDFALWKAWSAEDGDVFWETPIGKGRPGWHIECSAMSSKLLGQPFDIHTGGVDLIFPHHTNEMAQSECLSHTPLARYWLHNEHLIVNGRKMAKSAGNFYTLRQLLEKGHSAASIRFELLRSHYRAQLDFREEHLSEHRHTLERVNDLVVKLKGRMHDQSGAGAQGWMKLVQAARRRFTDALDDDLGISGALTAFFDFMGECNRAMGQLSSGDAEAALGLLKELDAVFGCVLPVEQELPASVRALIEQRELARSQKDFASADLLRKQLLDQGVVVKDTPRGTVWFRK